MSTEQKVKDDKGHRRKQPGNQSSSAAKKYDDCSPIVQAFYTYQADLDKKHDRYERLVKLSRDVTIESKRVIFLLQRVSGSEDEEAENLLKQAREKLHELRQSKCRLIARELAGEDPYQFLRAYSPGIQEYIEAVTLLHYLQDETLVSLAEVSKDLHFKLEPDDNCDDSGTAVDDPEKSVSVFVSPVDYMLGIADLTGELMRIAINCIGSGDITSPFKLCVFLRTVHRAFMSFENSSRELSRKLTVLRQSLKKVETACYTLQVRGSEIPTHMLIDVLKTDPGPYTADHGEMLDN
ncbi:translin-associated protein X-like isoform X2 [Liolophura sinensis]|uniref:translin-associated protein X-like isoform X2 n=1 Tax=Liolophura sinensis TaxID=3198878 RepID=UPI0031587DAB